MCAWESRRKRERELAFSKRVRECRGSGWEGGEMKLERRLWNRQTRRKGLQEGNGEPVNFRFSLLRVRVFIQECFEEPTSLMATVLWVQSLERHWDPFLQGPFQGWRLVVMEPPVLVPLHEHAHVRSNQLLDFISLRSTLVNCPVTVLSLGTSELIPGTEARKKRKTEAQRHGNVQGLRVSSLEQSAL